MLRHSLSRPLAAATLLLAGSCSPVGTSDTATRRAPKLTIAAPTHDFGRVDQGTHVRHAFVFRNDGGLDLTIDNLRSGCACTAAAVTPQESGAPTRTIPPGGAGTIEASFDTSAEHGRQSRTISVYSNDPASPVTSLTLTGEVTAAVAAEPAQVYVGHVARGQDTPSDIRIVTGGGASVDGVESPGRVLAASLRAASIHLSIRPDAPLGRFTESVAVRVANAAPPRLTIPVTGFVDDAAAAAPPEQP